MRVLIRPIYWCCNLVLMLKSYFSLMLPMGVLLMLLMLMLLMLLMLMMVMLLMLMSDATEHFQSGIRCCWWVFCSLLSAGLFLLTSLPCLPWLLTALPQYRNIWLSVQHLPNQRLCNRTCIYMIYMKLWDKKSSRQQFGNSTPPPLPSCHNMWTVPQNILCATK